MKQSSVFWRHYRLLPGPEDSVPRNPPYRSQYADNERVEWVASIGRRKFAIEVTQVQAMGEQIAMTTRLKRLCQPIALELDGKLPLPGIYDLVVQPGSLSGIKNKQLPAIRQRLTEWSVMWLRRLARKLRPISQGRRRSEFVLRSPCTAS